ncbi:hypothetical protein SUGI_0742540 [Cryptomeria japonica]|nr:hypothetical protein SUGI_0742540 [Cryptomeria japonica]
MNPEVFNVAKNGDLDTLKQFHGQNPQELKEVTFEGNIALHITMREEHLKLVEYGCMFGARNGDCNTPLHEATKRANAEIIHTLLNYNKYATTKCNQFGELALLIASEHGHVEVVRVLLKVTPVYIIL